MGFNRLNPSRNSTPISHQELFHPHSEEEKRGCWQDTRHSPWGQSRGSREDPQTWDCRTPGHVSEQNQDPHYPHEDCNSTFSQNTWPFCKLLLSCMGPCFDHQEWGRGNLQPESSPKEAALPRKPVSCMNGTDIQRIGEYENPVRPLAVDTELTDIALLDGLASVYF